MGGFIDYALDFAAGFYPRAVFTMGRMAGRHSDT